MSPEFTTILEKLLEFAKRNSELEDQVKLLTTALERTKQEAEMWKQRSYWYEHSSR